MKGSGTACSYLAWVFSNKFFACALEIKFSLRAPLKQCFCKLIRTSCTYCILYIICLIIFCFVTNKIVCSNINKVCLMFYYLKTLNKIMRELVLHMLFQNGSYFFRLFQRKIIYWVRNIFDFFYAVSVVLLVFAPSQDQHHIDSFHRHYVKQSKRKLLLEHFLVARQWQVSRTPSELLITQIQFIQFIQLS